MSALESIIDSLENRIGKVLHKVDVLQQTNEKLSKELEENQKRLLDQQEETASWQEKYDALKMANSLLGSNDNIKKTKLKINALVREIDHCIGQLSQ